MFIVLRDSTRIAGMLEDVARVSGAEYRDRYERWRSDAAEGARMPELGARIEVLTGRLEKTIGAFQGFGLAGIELTTGKDARLRTIEFSEFSSLEVHGGARLKSRDLEKLCVGGEVPLRTALQLRVDGVPRVVPLDDVAWVGSHDSGADLSPKLCDFNGRKETAGARWRSRLARCGPAMPRIAGRSRTASPS